MSYIAPVIRGVNSTDWDLRPVSFEAPTLIGIHLEIGDASGGGADLFQMELVNHAWIARNIEDCAWSWGRARMLLDEFDVDRVSGVITAKISELGPYSSWPEFAHRLSPYLIWEFEGMPYPPFPVLN